MMHLIFVFAALLVAGATAAPAINADALTVPTMPTPCPNLHAANAVAHVGRQVLPSHSSEGADAFLDLLHRERTTAAPSSTEHSTTPTSVPSSVWEHHGRDIPVSTGPLPTDVSHPSVKAIPRGEVAAIAVAEKVKDRIAVGVNVEAKRSDITFTKAFNGVSVPHQTVNVGKVKARKDVL